MKTRVVNLRREKYDMYIGRPGSADALGDKHFGSPFPVSKTLSREASVQKFRDWLDGKLPGVHVRQRKYILANYHRLKSFRLGCFCKPYECHGDVYVEMVE